MLLHLLDPTTIRRVKIRFRKTAPKGYYSCVICPLMSWKNLVYAKKRLILLRALIQKKRPPSEAKIDLCKKAP